MAEAINDKYENRGQFGFKMSHLSFFKGIAPGNMISENVYRWLCQNVQTDSALLEDLKDVLDVVVKTLKSDQKPLDVEQEKGVQPLKAKDICIEQLTIKNFRKFQGEDFTFRMKICCGTENTKDGDGKIAVDENGNSIGRSLFLIGN